MNGLVGNRVEFEDLERELKSPTDKRMFALAQAIEEGYPLEEIYRLSGVNPWFLHKIKNIIATKEKLEQLSGSELSFSLLQEAKKQGFSDYQIALLTGSDELTIRKKRKELGIIPSVKQIDTLAAEYPAKTNYLYLTYHGQEDDLAFQEKNQVIVLGGGPYRVGSSVEFDWCCDNAVKTLKKLNYSAIMINYNPETVSTDYDICDKLYFEELTLERICDIYEKEKPLGIIIAMGGQIPNNLALRFSQVNIKVLGKIPNILIMIKIRHKFVFLY
jgi:carbamoyl-phosphate synthase large subunit